MSAITSLSQTLSTLDLEACKETLRFASKEEIDRLAKCLTKDQYTYAIATLPLKKANELKEARALIQSGAIRA